VSGFLLPFGYRRSLLGPSCARWGVVPPSRTAYRCPLTSTGPQRGCRVAHEQDPTGQGASLTPGTVVRSRPAVGIRPAPAASQRPVPPTPLRRPIDEVQLSRGVIRGSLTFAHHPGTAGCRPRVGKPHGLPTGLLLARRPGWNEDGFGFYPRLRTPRLPTTHARAETGHRALTRVLHPRHQPNLQTGASRFTHAPSRRTQP